MARNNEVALQREKPTSSDTATSRRNGPNLTSQNWISISRLFTTIRHETQHKYVTNTSQLPLVSNRNRNFSHCPQYFTPFAYLTFMIMARSCMTRAIQYTTVESYFLILKTLALLHQTARRVDDMIQFRFQLTDQGNTWWQLLQSSVVYDPCLQAFSPNTPPVPHTIKIAILSSLTSPRLAAASRLFSCSIFFSLLYSSLDSPYYIEAKRSERSRSSCNSQNW